MILESGIDINAYEIRDYSNQGQEIWCYARFDDNEVEDEEGPKLRIRIHFSYSDVQRFTSLLQEWYQYLDDDITEL